MRIENDSPGYGRNKDISTYPENQWYRCSRCGFPCNKSRDGGSKVGSRIGQGNKHNTTTLTQDITTSTTSATCLSTSGFPSSGSVILHDTEKTGCFDYTGKTSTTFTGMDNISDAFLSGTNIINDNISLGCPQCGNLIFDKEELV